jgi:AcrR family transcriptional regulator
MATVGHREDLLAGAKRCIYERGYGRTTARDIVAASGTNLASIGYHYGSKEALLNAALIEATGEWGEEFGAGIATIDDPDPFRRFELAWDAVLASFAEHRQMLAAHFEAVVQAQHSDVVRDSLRAALDDGRLGLAELFYGLDPEADRDLAWAVGCFLNVVLTGYMAQWLVDPERAPTGRQLADGLRVVVAGAPSRRPEPA